MVRLVYDLSPWAWSRSLGDARWIWPLLAGPVCPMERWGQLRSTGRLREMQHDRRTLSESESAL